MRVEAITVCVGYGDFLAESLRENLPHLDYMVVATSPEDAETQHVCRQHSVQCLVSREWERNELAGSTPQKLDVVFNKGRLIRRLLDQIAAKDWILHLDADIILPRQFRRLLEVAHLNQQCIYGADRQDVVGWDAWQKLKTHSGPWNNHAHENGHWFHPHLPVSSRWVSSIHGYAPIGFFQLFHGSSIIQGGYHVRNYPLHHGDAARSDVQFALQWDRQQRHVVPEMVVLHLSSEEAPMGTNWLGRKTKRFRPPHHRPPHHRRPCS